MLIEFGDAAFMLLLLIGGEKLNLIVLVIKREFWVPKTRSFW